MSGRIRAVCIREVQNSIKDSVKQLLIDKIQSLEVGHLFDITETEIRGPNNSLIIFKGMQSYNAENIKSLENYDIAWVEEAQTLSEHSLKLLRPTIRADHSELWFSWNPRFKTDPVDRFFRQNPPDNAIVVSVNWRDNPWFPSVLHNEMTHDFFVDEDNALHVWEGAYFSGMGTILAKWINRAESQGRLNDCQYDPDGAPVFVSSDIGFRDTAAWWFWQPKLNGYTLFDYDQDVGMDADDWIPRIEDKLEGLKLGRIWLPHDARSKTFTSKHSSLERFIKSFGIKYVGIVPQVKTHERINAARVVVRKCEFNHKACEKGLDGLRAWQFEFNEETGILSKDPKHDWASHPGDAFSYGAQILTEHVIEQPEEKIIHDITNTSLNDLWALDRPRARERI